MNEKKLKLEVKMAFNTLINCAQPDDVVALLQGKAFVTITLSPDKSKLDSQIYKLNPEKVDRAT